jgi:hypothetical protein
MGKSVLQRATRPVAVCGGSFGPSIWLRLRRAMPSVVAFSEVQPASSTHQKSHPRFQGPHDDSPRHAYALNSNFLILTSPHATPAT